MPAPDRAPLDQPGAVFPTARCARCGVQVMAYETLDAQGELAHACLKCNEPILITDWCDLEEIRSLGYEVWEAPDPEAPEGCGGCSCGAAAPRRLS